MLNKQKIDEVLEPTITGLGYEYICSELANFSSGNKSGGVLRIFIDKLDSQATDNNGQPTNVGVTLDDCRLVSKHLSRLLEVETGIASKFSLEVSSPGLARPLVKLEHFKKFIGKKVKIKLHTALSNKLTGELQRNVAGSIKEVTEDGQIIILGDEKLNKENIIYHIELINIDKANLVPQWG